MTTSRPVRYRCELSSQIVLDSGGPAARTRILALSENGAFIEEVPELGDVQSGDGAVLGIPLPGGEPWFSHIRFVRPGRSQLELRTSRAEHLSVAVRGFGVEFDGLDRPGLDRLRDFLQLLDNR